MKTIHEKAAGHLAVEKTQSQLQRRGYWIGWRKNVKIFCQNCEPCNVYHRGAVPKQGNLQDMRVGEPFQRIHIDITGDHRRSDDGMIYILTILCSFSKFAIAVPLPNKSATTVVQALTEHVILIHGSPISLHSDMGREFVNSLMQKLCDELGIHRSHTTQYHAQGNGAVERWHRSLNTMLGKVVSLHQTDWPRHLPFVVNAYNTTEHTSTGFTPYFLLYGREQRTPIDVMMGDDDIRGQPVSSFAEQLVDRLRHAHAVVRENLKRAGERAQKYYDFGVRPKSFDPGEKV